MDEQKEAAYFHTLSDFVSLLRDIGIEQVLYDLKAYYDLELK